MNNNQDKNLCYVFSPSTAELAAKEWVESKIETDSNEAEALQICAVAMPWFLQHIQENASIYMFTHEDLLEEIVVWKEMQLASYPDQKDRIEETCDLVLRFFQSDVVKAHKMVIEA